MTAPAGFKALTGSVKDGLGNPITGNLVVTVTDDHNVPFNGGTVADTALTTKSAPIAVVAGALAAPAYLPDTTATTPTNLSLRLTIFDPAGNRVWERIGIQTPNATVDLGNLGTLPPLALAYTGPTGPQGLPGELTGPTAATIVAATLPVSRNLFDKTLIVDDYLIDWTTGIPSHQPGLQWFATGYMACLAGVQYVASLNTYLVNGNMGVAFYSAEQAYLGGVMGIAAGTPFTAPAGAVFMRLGTGGQDNVPGHTYAFWASQLMVVQGTLLPAAYLAFTSDDQATAATKLAAALDAALGSGRNRFDPTQIVSDVLINYQTGATIATPGEYFATGFVLVSGLASAICNQNTLFGIGDSGIAFYDAQFNYVGGAAGVTAASAFAIPAGAVYLRVGMGSSDNANAGIVPTVMIVAGDTLPGSYRPFGLSTSGYVQALRSLDGVTNLFDPAQAVLDTLIDYTTGAAINVSATYGAGNFFCTGYLRVFMYSQIVASQETLYGAGSFGFAFYDANFNFLSGVAGNVAGTPVTVPAGAFFARVGCGGTAMASANGWVRSFELATLMIVPGAIVPPVYIPFNGVAALVPSRFFGKAYCCVGDSITAYGEPNSYPEGSSGPSSFIGYQQPLCTALGMNKRIVYAVPGTRMVDVMASGYSGIITSTTIQAVDVMTIFKGTNDYGNAALGVVPLGDPITSTDSTTFFGAMDQIITTYLGWKPTLDLIFFTPLQRLNGTTSNSLGLTLEAYANAILTKCAQYGLPVVDLYHSSGINQLNLGTYAFDGQLHPNNAGYAKFTTQLVAKLAAI